MVGSIWITFSQTEILLYVCLNIMLNNVSYSIMPFQNVLDGDLCEQFNSIDIAKQKSIADDLDRTPSEVSKKLEDIRTRYAF